MNLHEAAQRLNGTVNGPWINVRGANHGAFDRSLGIRFDPKAPDGFYLHSFASDNEDECRAYANSLIQKLNVKCCDLSELEHVNREAAAACIKRAIAWWHESTSPTATPVETYFKTRRCALEGVFGADVVRFHPVCPFRTFRVPAMLALITDVVTGERIGVHRTALEDDGSGKRNLGQDISPKQIFGSTRFGAIRLQPVSDHLGISEGIESSLSAMQVFKTPVWAALSAHGIATFPIFPGIKRLTVFADHDQPGMTAAEKCCLRYNAAGIDAEIRHPSRPGTDWNDFVREEHDRCQWC